LPKSLESNLTLISKILPKHTLKKIDVLIIVLKFSKSGKWVGFKSKEMGAV